jgi:drug/metabolite transporter (DMT)-like permease
MRQAELDDERVAKEQAQSSSTADATTEVNSERMLAYGLLAFTMIVWGGSFVAARALLAPTNAGDATLTPSVLAALRFGIASALFVPPLVARWASQRNGAAELRRLDFGDLWRLIVMGQISIALYFWLQYMGVRLTNAGIAAILVVGLIPIATVLVARVRLGETFRVIHIAGLALGLAGVVVVTLQRESGLEFTISRDFALGAAFLVSNAILFALYSTLARGLRERFDPLTLTAGMTFTGAIGLVIMATVGGGWGAVADLSPGQWMWVAYLALICSVLAYFCYNRALAVLEAGRAATWVYIEPPVAIIFGALLLGEAIGIAGIAGGLIIALAVWVVSRGK